MLRVSFLRIRWVNDPGGTGRVPPSGGFRRAAGKSVITGIRPEVIGLADTNGVSADVLVVALRSRASLISSDRIRMSFDSTKVHLFDKDTRDVIPQT